MAQPRHAVRGASISQLLNADPHRDCALGSSGGLHRTITPRMSVGAMPCIKGSTYEFLIIEHKARLRSEDWGPLS